jgi:hypothetical protein
LGEESLPEALLVVERTLGGGACQQGKKQQHDPDATRHFQFPPALEFVASYSRTAIKGSHAVGLCCCIYRIKNNRMSACKAKNLAQPADAILECGRFSMTRL